MRLGKFNYPWTQITEICANSHLVKTQDIKAVWKMSREFFNIATSQSKKPVGTPALKHVHNLCEEVVSRGGRNQHWMIPYNVVPIYTGRQDIEQKLEESLLPSKSPNEFNKCYVLYGMGGSGKTQICLKFAGDHREM